MSRSREDEELLVGAIIFGLQTDLDRTLLDAPTLSVLRAGPPNGRFALVSGAPGRAFVANGGVSTRCDAPTLLERFASELSDAMAAGTFGPRRAWPVCEEHNGPLTPRRDGDEVFWTCRATHAVHVVARIGALGV